MDTRKIFIRKIIIYIIYKMVFNKFNKLNVDNFSDFICITTESPTSSPTLSPTFGPTFAPTESPTSSPTLSPTFGPTFAPTLSPTFGPTFAPTESPTSSPTLSPGGCDLNKCFGCSGSNDEWCLVKEMDNCQGLIFANALPPQFEAPIVDDDPNNPITLAVGTRFVAPFPPSSANPDRVSITNDAAQDSVFIEGVLNAAFSLGSTMVLITDITNIISPSHVLFFGYKQFYVNSMLGPTGPQVIPLAIWSTNPSPVPKITCGITQSPTFSPTQSPTQSPTSAPTFSPTQAPTPTPFPNPVVLLEFNNNSNLGQDISGNNNNFINNGAVQVGGGVTGDAIKISNTNQYLEAVSANTLNFDTGDKFSMLIWIKTVGTPGQGTFFNNFVGNFDNNNSSTSSGINVGYSNNRFYVELISNFSNGDWFNSFSDDGELTGEAIQDNNWHQFGFTYDGSNDALGVKYYLDGQPIPSFTSTNSLSGSILTSKKFRINNSPIQQSVVDYDNFRAYDVELSASQVNEIYNLINPNNITGPPVNISNFNNGFSQFKINNGSAVYALDPNNVDYCHIRDGPQYGRFIPRYGWSTLYNIPNAPDSFDFKGTCGMDNYSDNIIMGGCTYSNCPNAEEFQGKRVRHSSNVINNSVGGSEADCKLLAAQTQADAYWAYNKDQQECVVYSNCTGVVSCDTDDDFSTGQCVIS